MVSDKLLPIWLPSKLKSVRSKRRLVRRTPRRPPPLGGFGRDKRGWRRFWVSFDLGRQRRGASEGGAEIAGGHIAAGKVIGDILAGGLAGKGLGRRGYTAKSRSLPTRSESAIAASGLHRGARGRRAGGSEDSPLQLTA